MRRAQPNSSRPRHVTHAAWLGGLSNLFGGSKQQQVKGPKQERDRLMQLLMADGAPSTEAVDEINELVQVLEESELPFNEARIGGGPWVVSRENGEDD